MNKHFHRLQLAAGDFVSIQFMPLIPVFTVQGTLLIRFLLVAHHLPLIGKALNLLVTPVNLSNDKVGVRHCCAPNPNYIIEP